MEEKDLKSADEQLSVILRGVTDVVTKEDLAAKLKTGRQLIIKLGIDPTASDIHLGHTVTLNKLRQFQELGHKVVLIIGDYTAMVGDPSGRTSGRPPLTRDEIMGNVASYKQQVSKILKPDNLDIVFNGAWFEKLTFAETLKLVSKFTLAQMLEHDTFDRRHRDGAPLSLLEMMYPVMQGYDSVMIKADIEIGGTDQRFNVIAGRFLQRESGMEAQAGLFTPILLGLDGKNKMSKSLGNYIALNDKPEDMFGKVMSIPDNLMRNYFELLTQVDMAEIDSFETSMKDGKMNPRDVKMRLAFEIVKKYVNEAGASYGREYFEKSFGANKAIPYDAHVYSWTFAGDETTIGELLKAVNAAASNSDARRMVEQGGFYMNDAKVADFKRPVKKDEMPFTFKAGKKIFGTFR
jgi:tyrosyl-tRNA synthetase